MTDSAELDDNAKRLRSPPYPSVGLAKAIDRAKALYGKALHHSVPINVLADAWNYGIKSSGLSAAAATLNQFGLLNGQGAGPKRRYQLTDTAIRIIKDADPSSEKRLAAIKRAALAPAIFQELWETFGTADSVSDVVVRNFLTLDRFESGKAPFGDQAADDIIQTFKETLSFAGFTEADIMSPSLEEKPATGNEAKSQPSFGGDFVEAMLGFSAPKGAQPPPERPKDEVKLMAGERELTTGLLSKGASFRLIVNGAIGVKEIDMLIKKLTLDKEILADDPADNLDEEAKGLLG